VGSVGAKFDAPKKRDQYVFRASASACHDDSAKPANGTILKATVPIFIQLGRRIDPASG
jgi:hypothetical protein